MASRSYQTSNDKTIKVWDAATGGELMTLRGHEGEVISAAFSPDGKCIVSGSQDNTIKVWDAATGNELMTLRGHERAIRSVVFSPDGRRVVSSSEDKTIKVWDAAIRGDVVTLSGYRFSGYHSCFFSIAFSPDGKRIAAACWDGTAKVWDAATGAEVMTLRGHEANVYCVAFSPDGMQIVSSGEDKTIKVWDAATGTELMTLRVVDWPSSIAFSPDGKTIAAGCLDNGIKLWESTTLAGGYGPRKTAAAARKLVDELYQEHGFYSEVLDKLKTDKALAEPVRKVALQIANARLWEDAGKLCDESAMVIRLPGGDIKAYQVALQKAQKADRLEPNHPYTLTVLGAAQYRMGAYEEALGALKRSEKIIAEAHFDVLLLKLHPANAAFMAMALHQLGRDEEAQAALGRLRDLCKNEQFAEDKKAQAFLTEAEELFASEKQ